MRHLNRNLMCAIDINTTGPIAYKHDIIEIALLPLDINYTLHKEFKPFHIFIKPQRGTVEEGYVSKIRIAKANAKGKDVIDSPKLFDYWYESLQLRYQKKLMLLGYKLHEKVHFLIDWLGSIAYKEYIHENIRDICSFACNISDRTDLVGGEFDFPKYDLGYLYSMAGFTCERTEDCMETANMIAQTYYKMLRMIK